jgi:vacuolar-type H+-ATPase subunit H
MSEKNLEGLIAILKKEAIEAAEKQAGEIVAKAREEARAMLEEAAATKAEILQHAEAEANATREKGESALRQAARDLRVSVRNDLLTLLKAVLEREVENAFSPELIEKAVLKILENVGSGASLELSGNLGAELADQIQYRLQASGDWGSISRDASLVNGFAISREHEGWTYQVTPEEVTELLHAYLSPKWIEIFKKTSEA